MENKVALINQDGLVENVIICSDEVAATLGYAQVVNVTNYQGLVQGWMKYQDGKFLFAPDEQHTDWWYPGIEVTRI